MFCKKKEKLYNQTYWDCTQKLVTFLVSDLFWHWSQKFWYQILQYIVKSLVLENASIVSETCMTQNNIIKEQPKYVTIKTRSWIFFTSTYIFCIKIRLPQILGFSNIRKDFAIQLNSFIRNKITYDLSR